MRLSNIRKEQRGGGKSSLVVDLECTFSTERTLWFSVDNKYDDWLTDDVYDAFLVESIYLAMYHGENIIIDGNVNKKIYKNLIDYIIPVIKAMNPTFHDISIEVAGFANAHKNDDKIIGTGFSGGVDSFSTIIDKFEKESDIDYRINTLFFFNVGQYRGNRHQERLGKALQYFENSNEFAKEIKLPYVFVDCNMFDDLYLPKWEYDAGPLCRIAAILVFQRALVRYYISGSNHYLQQNSSHDKHLDDVTDEFIYTMTSPNDLEMILDGNQYYRSQKVENISKYEYVTRHLNVCVSPNVDVRHTKNCSICHKCLRTLIVLEAMGCLNDFSTVFNIEQYKKVAFRNKCYMRLEYGRGAFATENVNFAIEHGIRMPNKFVAWWYLFPQRVVSKISSFFK